MTTLPPIEKIYEAWTAVADGRVELSDTNAKVSSSDGTKEYTVRFAGDTYSSNDNATFWRGYAGYPVIAVLMLQGKLPLDLDEAKKWKGINWTSVNKKHRNNYQAAVKEIEEERGLAPEPSATAASKVMDALKQLPIQIKRKI
ncbi:MAG: hypothetical protein J1E38_09635 [Paramuribaculum sp.]|nr:hypothetical protein [Paramuribaculum sp.]